MKRIVTVSSVLGALVLVACSSSSSTGGSSGGTGNDAGTDSGTDGGDCTGPQGTTCPPTAGNCKGIGKPCSKGGKECADNQLLMCDADLDAQGKGICITIGQCAPGKHQCGTGATCCQTPTTQNVAVCSPNACIPADCTAEP